MNKENFDKKSIYELPSGVYGRYKFISEIIRRLKKKRTVSVLDVGGHLEFNYMYTPLLQMLLPSDHIVVLDKTVDKQPNYIVGDALSLPFSDKEFDFVVSSDTIEHITNNQRRAFLDEKLRVAKDFVILSAPFRSKANAEAEEIIRTNYESLFSEEHPWLSEHLQYGLPNEDRVVRLLRKKKLNYSITPHGNLSNWMILMVISFLRFNHRQANIQKEVFKLYSKKLALFDNVEPTYRKIFVISRKPVPDYNPIAGYSRKPDNITFQLLVHLLKQLMEGNEIIFKSSFAVKDLTDYDTWKKGIRYFKRRLF